MNTRTTTGYDSRQSEPAKRGAVLIPVTDLAKILSISPRSVWRLLSAGKMLQPVRIGGAVRWRYEEVLKWIEDGCPEPTQSDT